MRARLGKMNRGQELQFICADNMAGKMERVIHLAGGVIREQEQETDGTVITVMKAE